MVFAPRSAFRENYPCESVVFTHVILAEAVFIEVWQRSRVKFGGGCVYTSVTEVKV